MDKLKYIKLENEDGSYSSSIPLAVDSDYVDINGNTLTNILGTLATKTEVQAVASGSPLVASSISDMTDTTRSYVLVTDGHWYWYDGTAWQDGGIYQSTGISDNSINILMLKDNIQSNFNKEYSENLLTASAQGATNGYYKIDALTNKAVFISNSLYTNYDVDLNVGDIYAFTGYNVYELKGLIICDGNDNVIYSPASGTTHIREQYNVSAIFNVKDIGLHAYVSIYNNFTPYNEIVNLRKVTNIYNNLKIASNELEPIFTLNNCYIAYDNTHNNNVISLSQNSSYNVTCYPVASGLTYKVKYKGYYNVRGACLTSLSNGLIWIDDSVDEETYEFTAEQDGYLYLCNLSPFVKGSVELVYKAININGENILKNKKIIYDGDSICESRLGASANNGGGYAYQIAQNTGGTYVNQAVGGGTLSYISAQTAHSVVNNLENLPTDGDIYCFEGGVNDWWGNRELGTFSKTDYTGDLDVSTISGALETIFRYAINNFQGKPIVFVIIHKVNQPYSVFRAGTFEDVRARFIEICEKYAIPYFDAWKDSGLNGIITSQMNAYLNANATGTPDGTHPNANGYKYFYTPQLTALFESVISRT